MPTDPNRLLQPPDPMPAARRIRRAARLLKDQHGNFYAAIPHADWIDFCNELDGITPTEHNRERGAYFGAMQKRTRNAT